MNIMDLDEAEGLTAEMLVAYLVREGYAQTTYHTTTEHWQKRVGRILYQINVLKIERSVQLLATWAKVSPQSILREMNPRMRKGLPSAESRAAHEGPWIAETVSGSLIVGIFMEHLVMGLVLDCFGMTLRPLSDWSFWPCDAHGNKVRWPSLAGGEGRR